MATSKIKSCTFKSEWTNPKTNKIVYYHDVEFENGDKGQIGTLTSNPDKLSVGTEHTYHIEQSGNNKKIVIEQPQNGFKGGSKFNTEFEEKKQKMIIAQSSLSSACNMYNQGSKTPEQILEIAEKFYNWVINTAK